MKKIVASLLCMTMASAAACSLGACKPGSTSVSIPGVDETTVEAIQKKYDASLYEYGGEPCTITMSHWDSDGATIEKAVCEVLLGAFHNRYPDITVDLDIISDYETTYASNIATGNLHDVFMVSDGVFNNWAPGSAMVNLDPYIESSDLVDPDDMYPSVVSRYKYNSKTGLSGEGNQLVMPRDISTHVMYYNKNYFDSKGVSYPASDRIMTMDEATEMWKKLTTRREDGSISVYGTAGMEMEGLVWSAGGDFLNDARNAFPTEKRDLDALKKAYRYIQDGYYTHEIMPPSDFSSGMDPTTLFSLQKVATVIAGSWEVATLRSLSFDWDIAYVPAFPETPTANGWSGSMGYAISNKCTNKEAAWKLVEYIGSKEGQEILSATGFQFPLYTSLGLDEDYLERNAALKPNNYEIFIKSAEKQPAGVWSYLRSQSWKELGYDLYSEYLLDGKAENRWTVDHFLEVVKGKVNELVG